MFWFDSEYENYDGFNVRKLLEKESFETLSNVLSAILSENKHKEYIKSGYILIGMWSELFDSQSKQLHPAILSLEEKLSYIESRIQLLQLQQQESSSVEELTQFQSKLNKLNSKLVHFCS
jgi:hypothetical protein